VVSDSGQKFIRRNRAPRVHITYEDPYDADKLIELPFVMGVMSDLSGNNAGAEKPDITDRGFLDFDMDNFDKRMAAIQPGVKFHVKMDDFKPAAIARQVPALAKLLEARENLKNLQTYMDGKADAEAKLKELLNDPALMAALKQKMSKDAGPES
jgi:type VI secretion system protein ImpB